MLERVKDPLQTLVSRDHFETAYAVLAHFLLIAQRAPILFSGVSTLTDHGHLSSYMMLLWQKQQFVAVLQFCSAEAGFC